MSQPRRDQSKNAVAQRKLTLILHNHKTKKTKLYYFLRRRTKKFPGCINARLRMPRKGAYLWMGEVASKADFEKGVAVMEWLEERKMYMLVHVREDHEVGRLTRRFLSGLMTYPDWNRATEGGVGPVTLGFRTQDEMIEFKMRWY